MTVGKNADVSSFPVDASLCGLHEGDQLTLETLLYGLLLSSGNDAATAIAEYISGSEEAFVEEMNDRAKELMAVNTHFMNPHGLHDENHYTCLLYTSPQARSASRSSAFPGQNVWHFR